MNPNPHGGALVAPQHPLGPDLAELLLASQLLSQYVEQSLRGGSSPTTFMAALSILTEQKSYFPSGPH